MFKGGALGVLEVLGPFGGLEAWGWGRGYLDRSRRWVLGGVGGCWGVLGCVLGGGLGGVLGCVLGCVLGGVLGCVLGCVGGGGGFLH